ncbi:hypothetical protein DO944_03090 [Microbacterium sp. SMR1]|nr:hypothetical protein DO944_03090 [Microbacterium sp. SMR1]
MSASACRVDRSPDTGSLVVCTCGLSLGPFMDHARAISVARDHRDVHKREKARARLSGPAAT